MNKILTKIIVSKEMFDKVREECGEKSGNLFIGSVEIMYSFLLKGNEMVEVIKEN